MSRVGIAEFGRVDGSVICSRLLAVRGPAFRLGNLTSAAGRSDHKRIDEEADGRFRVAEECLGTRQIFVRILSMAIEAVSIASRGIGGLMLLQPVSEAAESAGRRIQAKAMGN